MATILEANVRLDDELRPQSVSQLQYIYTNIKAEWERIKDHIECPNCGLPLMLTHRNTGTGNYLRRYPKTDHADYCPYVEERVTGNGRTLIAAEDVGLSDVDARNKAKYAMKRLLETPEDKAARDQKRKDKKQKTKPKGTKVTDDASVSVNVSLKKEYDENDPRPRRTPQYRSAIGGDVTEDDLGKAKTFIGYISNLEFRDQNMAFPVLGTIKWGDRSGTVVMTQEMFNGEANLRELLIRLKNHIDEGNEVLFTALVEVIYEGNNFVGALSGYKNMWFGADTTTLVDYLFINKIIGYR